MAYSSKTFSNLFLPGMAKGPRSRRAAPIEDNAAIQAIWDVTSAIPRGHVATYGEVARAAGLPGRARLAGFALKVAPPGINLPWHRVVGAGGRIVFPKSSQQYREQAKRLRADGVSLKNGRVSGGPRCGLEL